MTEQRGRVLCQNRVLALVWRCLILAACGGGLGPMFFGPSFSGLTLSYFTTQSNLLVAALFLVLTVGTARQLVRGGRRGGAFSLPMPVQLAVVFFIQITFLVFAGFLSGGTFSMGSVMAISNLLLHYVVPLMALADWLFFQPHGLVGWKHAACWLCYPAAYVAFAFIRATLGPVFYNGSRFPYYFMDADILGLNLLWICPLFFLGFFGLACVIVAADRALGRRRG